MMKFQVVSVKPPADYKLLLTFKDNSTKIFDMTPYLRIGKYKELKDKAMFDSVKVKFDSIEWGNGLDIDPEFLYGKSRSLT